jgi:flagellar basal-body rod modification protein FlgD
MTLPINGTVSTDNPVAAPGTSLYTNSTTKNVAKSNLGDQDTFLKLLVAQLRYQDPSKPADSTQFLAQTAQFTQVEKLGQIADMIKSQSLIGASALVGRTVTYLDTTDAATGPQTGVVTTVKLNGASEPTLMVGGKEVQLSTVTEIQNTATGPQPDSTVPPTKES